MDMAVEVLTFVGGCIFYAARGWLGKVLLNFIGKLLKLLFRFTETEALLYAEHKAATIDAKRSGTLRAQK